MVSPFAALFACRNHLPPWNDKEAVRHELFGGERLEQHAESLAAAQQVIPNPRRVLSLHARLRSNAAVLQAAYHQSAAEVARGQEIVPAAEWLLDNYPLIEEQIRTVREDMPPGYYRQLPKLVDGPFAGYPRVFGIAWAFVAHTDSHLDPDSLQRFLAAYQRVQPLTIGELWAVSITLRIVLIENLRRLVEQIAAGRAARAQADAFAKRLLAGGNSPAALETDQVTLSSAPLSERFAAQLAKRLRDQDPRTTPALGWLEKRLLEQNTSIEEVVRHAQQRQGASNVTVRNIIISIRLISDLDWVELFERVSLVDERLRSRSPFASMDLPTRNLYRSAIEQLARGSTQSELAITDRALDLSRSSAATAGTPVEAERMGDPGWHLIGEGRKLLEVAIGFRAPVRLKINRLNIRLGMGGYVGAILVISTLLLALSVSVLRRHGVEDGSSLMLFLLFSFLPATVMAGALVNRALTLSFGSVTLPGLEFLSGVPTSHRTLVAVPTLLTNQQDLLEQIERLEVHYLSGAGGDLSFALLSDGVDADSEVLAEEAKTLAAGAAAVAALNARHRRAPGGTRFFLLHRRRLFNARESKWMGWERKRGKLHELNRLLRGATDTTFIESDGGTPNIPRDVRYVITLDADTRLPREAALALVGKMAHPLNLPRFDAAQRRVVSGYAILQPRITPSLPLSGERSLYQRASSGPGGMDPYAAATSDIYQDLFGEGSYTGKGIYDVDAFEASLAGRVPPDTMLSHDLFEGVFARAGLASDIELFEDFPARYDVAAKRQHRWMRGDWQLLPWILKPRQSPEAIPAVGLGKMLDNLRRSLVAPFTLAALWVCWLLPGANVIAIVLLLGATAVPALLSPVLSLLLRRPNGRWCSHARATARDFSLSFIQTGLLISFLPDQAWRAADAIVRTMIRIGWTHRHLLEWTTAAQASGAARLGVRGFYWDMAGGVNLGLAAAASAIALATSSWPWVLPFAALWLVAPAIAFWTSRSAKAAAPGTLSEADARSLRLTARRTWRFFERFVTHEDNMLPPDNFQEDPKPVVAHRTSPTNIGLYLLSTVAARDFGWAGTSQTVERLEATFATLENLSKFNGHFFNWYDTQDLRALEPAYISSVDSGNLAGHLIAVANACEEWTGARAMQVRQGIADTVFLAREALGPSNGANSDQERQLSAVFDQIEQLLLATKSIDIPLASLVRLATKTVRLSGDAHSSVSEQSGDLSFWTAALVRTTTEHGADRGQDADAIANLVKRLRVLAAKARRMALDMNFTFLVDPERKLLSIGYSVGTQCLDKNCYDLLASEARLASLFAIAKGDVPTRHWFRLGRTATPVGTGSALISWSGSMFEYLMPSLVMRAPVGSILEQTSRLVVERQRSYASANRVPWGISESAYNARDIELTYQYSNFGVPGLGLKRGLIDNLVIAPYATGLATMVDPAAALDNLNVIAALGGRGRYGFYEALDFTKSRLPDNKVVSVVRSFMAHHQGMTIVAIANTLQDARMRDRFHREPMIRASELLLQERMPRTAPVLRLRTEAAKAAHASAEEIASATRHFTNAVPRVPVTHLLSNGRYAVMLTTSGSGYSRWQGLAVTRWREDPTLDDWGSFIFLKDVKNGRIWSAGSQPLGTQADQEDIFFREDNAEFVRRDGNLTTSMEVLVSGEDDGEVRRVSLFNGGRAPRHVELTSYAELVLTTAAADNAHPAFAKLFVQTEHLAEYEAIVATRRPRAPEEELIWAAHFAVVEGEITADPQHESDRSRFIGRSRSIRNAAAIVDGLPLSNTVGTVLDPIFSLRYQLKIEPGQTARVSFWTVVASTRTELLNLIDKHHDRNAFERAKTLAWTQQQAQLSHLNITTDEAANFQRLAAPTLYADARFRPASNTIVAGAGPQSSLWPHGISGDLPIVLMCVDDFEDMAQVRQLLRAHEYWRMKRMAVDLVILNERSSSYIQDLQVAIEAAVRSSPRPHSGDEQNHGAVFVLRTDLISAAARSLLYAVSRVVMAARTGPLAAQLARLSSPSAAAMWRRRFELSAGAPHLAPAFAADLEFSNGTGGFDANGREYVIVLNGGHATPAPWINIIANSRFGFQVSADGSGTTWAENSRENQLTPWSNDPVSDAAGEALYIRDDVSNEIWSPTPQPINDRGEYVARHGFGYSRFEHEAHGIATDLLQYVPLVDPIKISRLTLRNLSDRPRKLSVTSYAEWVLGPARRGLAPFIATERDVQTGALLAQNPWSIVFPGRVAFFDLGGRQKSWSGDRTAFLGRNGATSMPAALGQGALSGQVGAGLDPCAALQTVIELGVGETVEVVSFLGQCLSLEEARALIVRYRAADLDAVLDEVKAHWNKMLGAVQVRTPDRAMDIMLNGWLLYQTLACRIVARSAFYQSSGAYGFRDQLQDGMALAFAAPDETRRHLVRAAARQFVENDFQHWWLPQSGQGARARISDDGVWLAYATATYVATSGDESVLDEVAAFLEGRPLAAGEHDAFYQPTTTPETATLFEHCCRALDRCLDLTGEHGLPLIGTGDWNDGMNRVGEGGRGESVWLAWLLLRTIAMFAPFADSRDPIRAGRWRDHAETLRAALEQNAWDGEWYRRATFDDGTWLGAKTSEGCQIDSIAQSWAVLSGEADPQRAAVAMASLKSRLVRSQDGICVLFTPPFDKDSRDPGYIKGYPPGIRENGGQYTHAAAWSVQAFAKLGDGDKAHELLAMINPINHALTGSDTQRYKVEPYVACADVYSVAPHVGRGGWTWYTGSAGWLYRAGMESILGFNLEGASLRLDPCIPKTWSHFKIIYRHKTAQYEIRVENPDGVCRGIRRLELDGNAQPGASSRIALMDDGILHHVRVVLG